MLFIVLTVIHLYVIPLVELVTLLINVTHKNINGHRSAIRSYKCSSNPLNNNVEYIHFKKHNFNNNIIHTINIQNKLHKRPLLESACIKH